jgi:hypothetical protein
MAMRADTPIAPSRRRLPAAPVAPVRRRGGGLPSHLAHLAPLLANRSRIEAQAAALIDLLDAERELFASLRVQAEAQQNGKVQ